MKPEEPNPSDRMHILEMIDAGKITAEQGLLLLQAVAEGQADPAEDQPLQFFTGETLPTGDKNVESPSSKPGSASGAGSGTASMPDPSAETAGSDVRQTNLDTLPPEILRRQNLWLLPFGLGAVLCLLAVGQVFQLAQTASLFSALLCPGTLFITGIIIMALSWEARHAHWIHLRIEQPPGSWPRRISISFPLPLGLLAMILHHTGKISPEQTRTSIEGIINAIQQHATAQDPLLIEVDEGDNGHKVRIFVS